MIVSVKTLTRLAMLMLATATLGGSALARGVSPACKMPPSCPTGQVPEMDPGSAASALTLLAGGVLSLVDRRRRSG